MDKVKFTLGQIVFLVINPDDRGMVTGILFRPNGVQYAVTWEDKTERWHYDCELTTEKKFEHSST